METEERIKALEDEFLKTKSETKQLMLDIRALLMEAMSPLRSQSGNVKSTNQSDGQGH
jgi:hypothetical protein